LGVYLTNNFRLNFKFFYYKDDYKLLTTKLIPTYKGINVFVKVFKRVMLTSCCSFLNSQKCFKCPTLLINSLELSICKLLEGDMIKIPSY